MHYCTWHNLAVHTLKMQNCELILHSCLQIPALNCKYFSIHLNRRKQAHPRDTDAPLCPNSLREAFQIKNVAQIWVFFPKGGGVPAEPKVLRHFFFASKPPKGRGVRSNPKVLKQFWGSFGAVLRQNFCNISSISKGRNDFTHHQLKDYDVFSVKNLQ